MQPRLILASGSPYRRELLQRLHLPFQVLPADIKEARLPGEAASQMALRLAQGKAAAIAGRPRLDDQRGQPTLVIGSDQTVELGNEILGKPGDHEAAVRQLGKLSGREVLFHTGLCLMAAGTDQSWSDCITVKVRFRRLQQGAIKAYVKRERPYACAGGFQAEGYGITLVESIESDDPTALIGLPLIRLCGMLRAAGVQLP